MDHIDHAIAIARKYRHSLRMVTIEGESFSPGGSMSGGSFKNNSNLLGRRREIEELESSVKALKSDMDKMQRDIDDNRSRRNVMRDTIADFQEKLRQQYVAQNTAKMNINQVEARDPGNPGRLRGHSERTAGDPPPDRGSPGRSQQDRRRAESFPAG